MASHILINALFVVAVTLIWFMLAWQTLLFFLGHRYYRWTRRPGPGLDPPDEELPAVSILVPCRNEELVIAETIRSLLALDYPAWKLEILIVNDASTDRTGEIARGQDSGGRVLVIDVPP